MAANKTKPYNFDLHLNYLYETFEFEIPFSCDDATLSKLYILAHCAIEIDTPALEESHGN